MQSALMTLSAKKVFGFTPLLAIHRVCHFSTVACGLPGASPLGAAKRHAVRAHCPRGLVFSTRIGRTVYFLLIFSFDSRPGPPALCPPQCDTRSHHLERTVARGTPVRHPDTISSRPPGHALACIPIGQRGAVHRRSLSRVAPGRGLGRKRAPCLLARSRVFGSRPRKRTEAAREGVCSTLD